MLVCCCLLLLLLFILVFLLFFSSSFAYYIPVFNMLQPTELAACGDGKVIIDPPVTSPHSSTTTSTPPTSAATTASPQTSTTTKALPVSGGDTKNSKVRHSAMAEPGAKSELLLEVGDLETATRYTLKLTPWFVDCGASDSRAFRGKTKSLSEVTTLFQGRI